MPGYVKFDKRAIAALACIPNDVADRMREDFNRLREDWRLPGSIKLEGQTHDGLPIWRVKRGYYRFLYVASGNPYTVTILDIGDRKDIYR